MIRRSRKYLIQNAIYQLENVAKKRYGFDIERFYNTLKEDARLLYRCKTPIEHKHMISMIRDGLENTLEPSNRWPTGEQIKALTGALNLLNKKCITVYNLEETCKEFAEAHINLQPKPQQQA